MTQRRDFMTGTVSGAFAAFLLSNAHAQQTGSSDRTTAQERDNIQLVDRFCKAWEAMDLSQVVATMRADAVYRQSQDTPPVTGHQALIDMMQPWVDSSHAITYRVLDTFARGPVVINHRIDIYHSDTNHLEWEGVGLFLIEDSLIREWQDFTMRIQRGRA